MPLTLTRSQTLPSLRSALLCRYPLRSECYTYKDHHQVYTFCPCDKVTLGMYTLGRFNKFIDDGMGMSFTKVLITNSQILKGGNLLLYFQD